MTKRLFAAASAFLALTTAAPAQNSIQDIAKSVGGRAGDIAQAEELLRSPDRNQRIAAMEALLNSKDPAFIQVAKEAGLTSSDPTMRAAAARAILDAGGNFVAELLIPPEDKDQTQVFRWLEGAGRSWSSDRRVGFYNFAVGPYNETKQCWVFLGSDACALSMSGESVSTGYWRYGNLMGHSIMSLDETGALTGAFVVAGRGTPVTIRIPLLN